MSSNKLINAVIAMIEDRFKDAREMLRSPEMKVSSSELQMRLATAIRKREGKFTVCILKRILQESIRVDPAKGEAFLEGVAYMEGLIDDKIEFIELCTESEDISGSLPEDTMHPVS